MGQPFLSNMTLKRIGFEGRLVSHGMRSMASTFLNEHGWEPELIEVALAHVDKDEVLTERPSSSADAR